VNLRPLAIRKVDAGKNWTANQIGQQENVSLGNAKQPKEKPLDLAAAAYSNSAPGDSKKMRE
jgi:hypothetical protein